MYIIIIVIDFIILLGIAFQFLKDSQYAFYWDHIG